MKCESGCLNVEVKKIYSYDGFNKLKLGQCPNCKYEFKLSCDKEEDFKKQVNNFKSLTQDIYEEFPEKLEVFAQAILRKIMPDYSIVDMDNGNGESGIDMQYDLLVKKDHHHIAIEVSQLVDSEAIMEKKKFLKSKNCQYVVSDLKRDWTVCVDPNKVEKINLKEIKKLLILIEKDESLKDLPKIDYDEAEEDNLDTKKFHADFFREGIIVCYGQIVAGGTLGSIQIWGYFNSGASDSSFLDFKKIRKICVSNLKKLKQANILEKHIFIPVTHSPNSFRYIQKLSEPEKYSKKFISEEFSLEDDIIPGEISCIWLALLRRYNRDRMGFQLVKIINGAYEIAVEKITPEVVPYL